MDRTRFSRGSARSSAITQSNVQARSAGRISTDQCEEGFDNANMRNCGSLSSRLTQEWLEEAKRIMTSSPSPCDSSAKITGSPRFGSVRISTGPLLCRKDPLSRSARRNRATEGFSEEILNRSARHSRNGSILSNIPDPLEDSTSPTSQVNIWITKNIQPPNDDDNKNGVINDSEQSTLLQRKSTPQRRSRFQAEPKQAQDVPRRFKQGPNMDGNRVLSPPKNLVESAHRRSISRSTCLMDKLGAELTGLEEEEGRGGGEQGRGMNGFLKKQRAKFGSLMSKKA
ncbi:hypothetical protein LINPERHAP2_LOCUS34222 [Linum perenne]